MARPLRSIALGGVLLALVFAAVGLTGAVASEGNSKHHGHHGHHGTPSIVREPFGTAPGGIAVDNSGCVLDGVGQAGGVGGGGPAGAEDGGAGCVGWCRRGRRIA